MYVLEWKVWMDECVVYARGRGSVSAGKRRDCVWCEDGCGDVRN